MGVLDCFDEGWQMCFDMFNAHAHDECYFAWFIGGVERVDKREEFIGCDGMVDFDAYRVVDAPRKYSMCAPSRFRVRWPIHGMCVVML